MTAFSKANLFAKLCVSLDLKKRYTSLRTLVVGIRYACNLRCVMCEWIYTWSKKPWEDMSITTFNKIIRDAKNLGCRKINISGGEPSLHPNFIDMLRLCKKYRLNVMLTTNLTTAESVKAWKWVDEYQCSIDGTEETYEKIRKNAKWETVYKNLEKLAKVHDNVRIAYVIQRLNWKEFDKIIPIAQKLKIRGVDYCFQFNVIPQIASKVELRKSEMETVLQRFNEIKNKMDVEITFAESDLQLRKVDRFPCYHQYFQAVILPNGDVYPCCACVDIDRHAKPYGNVHEQSLIEIWKNNIWNGEICKRCPVPHFNPFRNPVHVLRHLL